MNLALGAVILAIILIPPLIFLYCFSKGTHGRDMPKFGLIEYLLLAAVLALFFHSLAIKAANLLFHQKPDYHFIFQFLTGKLEVSILKSVNIENYFFDFVNYTFWLCLVSGISGYLLQWIVTSKFIRTRNWVQKMWGDGKPPPLLCYFNDWWYFFRANEYSRQYKSIVAPSIYTHAIIDTKDTSILYSGILKDFCLKDGGLEFIYLSNVTKTILNKRKATGELSIEEGESMEIKPDGLMCIPYSRVINLFISFIDLKRVINESERIIEEPADYFENVTLKPNIQQISDN